MMIIWILLTVVFGILALKWYVACLITIRYMLKKGCTPPEDKDLRECTDELTKEVIKKLKKR